MGCVEIGTVVMRKGKGLLVSRALNLRVDFEEDWRLDVTDLLVGSMLAVLITG